MMRRSLLKCVSTPYATRDLRLIVEFALFSPTNALCSELAIAASPATISRLYRSGHTAIAEQIVECRICSPTWIHPLLPAYPKAKQFDELKLLDVAIQYGSSDEFLLRMCQGGILGIQPLTIAAWHGRMDTVRTLFDNHQLHYEGQIGQNRDQIYVHATRHDHVDIVKWLIVVSPLVDYTEWALQAIQRDAVHVFAYLLIQHIDQRIVAHLVNYAKAHQDKAICICKWITATSLLSIRSAEVATETRG